MSLEKVLLKHVFWGHGSSLCEEEATKVTRGIQLSFVPELPPRPNVCTSCFHSFLCCVCFMASVGDMKRSTNLVILTSLKQKGEQMDASIVGAVKI